MFFDSILEHVEFSFLVVNMEHKNHNSTEKQREEERFSGTALSYAILESSTNATVFMHGNS